MDFKTVKTRYIGPWKRTRLKIRALNSISKLKNF